MSGAGLDEIIGAPVEVQVSGRTLKFSEITPRDFAEARAHLKAMTPNPLAALKENLQGLSEPVQVALAKEAYQAFREWGLISSPEGRAWANSVEGVSFFVWRSVVKCHPELTLADVEALVSKAGLVELAKIKVKLDEVSGLVDSGNSQRPSSSPRHSADRGLQRRGKRAR